SRSRRPRSVWFPNPARSRLIHVTVGPPLGSSNPLLAPPHPHGASPRARRPCCCPLPALRGLHPLASAGAVAPRRRGAAPPSAGHVSCGQPRYIQEMLSYEFSFLLIKNGRWRPAFVLETGGPSNTDGQDFDEDSGFLGSTRLGRLIQAAGRELLEKLNSSRINTPTKIFLVLLGFYTANALATILGQTGDWDVLVAAVVVAAIEGIGMLMYRIPITKRAGRIQSLVSMVNYWKAGVCLGLFVDAFKVGS
ncbi:unnamed protein product, partial [Urochloa humidicola]